MSRARIFPAERSAAAARPALPAASEFSHACARWSNAPSASRKGTSNRRVPSGRAETWVRRFAERLEPKTASQKDALALPSR